MDATYEYVDESSVDRELICNICHSPLQDPYCTPCGETFCRKCIVNWMQTQKASCPHCRQAISNSTLAQAPRSLRNMLDRLSVKCMICEENGLQRVNFNDHIQKMCPKIIVSCPAADIKCLWKGQRDQLSEHLTTCSFEPMRHIITDFLVENQQLKDQVNQQTMEMTKLEDDIKHLKQKLRRELTRNQEYKTENERLKHQVILLQLQLSQGQSKNEQLKKQIDTYLRENQRLMEQLGQKHSPMTSMNNQSITQYLATSKALMVDNDIEKLKGTWDYVDGENFDEFMIEIGIGWAARLAAKSLKPRLVISEINGKWALKSENPLKAVTFEFTPGAIFDETTPDGRQLTSTINFEGNKWIHTSFDKNGKKSVVTRYIDDKGQQMIEMECGNIKARRWYKRIE